MGYTNSPLACKAIYSPNHSGHRKYPISRITPHCFVGQVTIDNAGAAFRRNGASCNYCVARDGKIVLIVDEENRSWCSSSSAAKNRADANDDKAVTIEVASDTSAPWAFTAAAYSALIELSADICRRNGKHKMVWINNKQKALSYKLADDEMLVTVHRWYAAKACPGDWMMARMDDYVAKVNAKLASDKPASRPAPSKPDTSGLTRIAGKTVATETQMSAYADKIGMPDFVKGIIKHYIGEGNAEGIRGDVAFAQSCLETGNFKFAGSAVTPDQNNFCGMGVTANGQKGNSFPDARTGIRAQVQHLKAYANKDPLKGACVDPRFKYVSRGSAEYVEWLGQKENPNGKGWASGAGYGGRIITILKDIMSMTTGSNAKPPAADPAPTKPSGSVMYRVRKSWADSKSQIGAYSSLANAKNAADKNAGYKVYDQSGKEVYAPGKRPAPFRVKVKITNLNIREKPDKDSKAHGYTGAGIFVITDVQPGKGSKAGWGKLKSGAGWISLDFAERL